MSDSEVEVIEKKESIDLNALIPLGMKFIESNLEQTSTQHQIERENIQLRKDYLEAEKTAYKHRYWLLVFITISIVGISAGLIFLKNDTISGMSILSHVGAVVVGIIAGSGWEKLRTRN